MTRERLTQLGFELDLELGVRLARDVQLNRARFVVAIFDADEDLARPLPPSLDETRNVHEPDR